MRRCVQEAYWVLVCLVTQSCLTLCKPMDCRCFLGDSPGKNSGVGCQVLLQGIFPTKGLNSGLLHYRWILYQLGYQRSPWSLPMAVKMDWVIFPLCVSVLEGETRDSGKISTKIWIILCFGGWIMRYFIFFPIENVLFFVSLNNILLFW